MVISSVGGAVNDAFAIIDTMRAINIPVHTYGLGQIYSCGLLIFMAGEQGSRFLFKNTSILSHQWSGFDEGKEHELKAAQTERKLVNARMLRHYELSTGMSKADILEKLLPAGDVYLSPKQAVDFHLADKIIASFI
jgi:ATP-dependent protease ClpP protease subunit